MHLAILCAGLGWYSNREFRRVQHTDGLPAQVPSNASGGLHPPRPKGNVEELASQDSGADPLDAYARVQARADLILYRCDISTIASVGHFRLKFPNTIRSDFRDEGDIVLGILEFAAPKGAGSARITIDGIGDFSLPLIEDQAGIRKGCGELRPLSQHVAISGKVTTESGMDAVGALVWGCGGEGISDTDGSFFYFGDIKAGEISRSCTIAAVLGNVGARAHSTDRTLTLTPGQDVVDVTLVVPARPPWTLPAGLPDDRSCAFLEHQRALGVRLLSDPEQFEHTKESVRQSMASMPEPCGVHDPQTCPYCIDPTLLGHDMALTREQMERERPRD